MRRGTDFDRYSLRDYLVTDGWGLEFGVVSQTCPRFLIESDDERQWGQVRSSPIFVQFYPQDRDKGEELLQTESRPGAVEHGLSAALFGFVSNLSSSHNIRSKGKCVHENHRANDYSLCFRRKT